VLHVKDGHRFISHSGRSGGRSGGSDSQAYQDAKGGKVMGMLSVTEYGALHKMDGGRIRVLIRQGRLPAQKVGNQWVIDEAVQPPEDRRVKSGKYKDWREKYPSSEESAKEGER